MNISFNFIKCLHLFNIVHFVVGILRIRRDVILFERYDIVNGDNLKYNYGCMNYFFSMLLLISGMTTVPDNRTFH